MSHKQSLSSSHRKRKFIDSTYETARKRRFNPAAKTSSQSTLSPLESLPTEVLEKIFLESLNLNLLKAAPRIACRLSSHYVRKELFFRTCCSQYDVDARSKPQSTDADLAEAQSSIFRQKWMTRAFVRQCMPDLVSSTITRELSKRQLHWNASNSDDPLSGPTVDQYIREIFSYHINTDFSHGLIVSYAVEWKESEGCWVNILLHPIEGQVYIATQPYEEVPASLHGPDNLSFFSMVNLCSTCRIPERYLRGPWSDEKSAMLDLLLKCNASIDRINTTSGEVAEEGFWDAIKEDNAEVLRLLATRTGPLTTSERLAAYRKGDTRNRGVGVLPHKDHLIFAVRSGCGGPVIVTIAHDEGSQIERYDRQIADLCMVLTHLKHPNAGLVQAIRDGGIEDVDHQRRGRENREKANLPTSTRDRP